MIRSVILAGGKGTRMVSDTPKVLHPLLGVPLLEYMLEKVEALGCEPRVVVVGHGKELVCQAFEGRDLTWAHQAQQLGTGHAAFVGIQKAIENERTEEGTALLLNGDLPLLRVETLQELLDAHTDRSADVTLLTCTKSSPHGYGRIVRDPSSGKLAGIVEEKDARGKTREIREINAGVYVFEVPVFMECFASVGKDNEQGEFYLTDVVTAAARKGKSVETCETGNETEITQVNSRKEMAEVVRIVRMEILDDLMAHGVTVDDPESTFVEKRVRIGQDSRLFPFTYICRDVEIGPGCEVGPFTHLRPGTVLAEGARVGNFVEIKASRLGEGSKARHLSYIGDATVGTKVNIGAGTIFANYDGKRKSHTVVKDRAFIGSGTILVAPVTVGEDSLTGAGAVVTRGRDVADGTVVVGVPARPLTSRPSAEPSQKEEN